MHGDTSPEATRVLRERMLRMTEAQRLEEGIRLSLFARQVMRAGIRARHPEYTAEDVEHALERLLRGDDLYRAARPNAPVLAP